MVCGVNDGKLGDVTMNWVASSSSQLFRRCCMVVDVTLNNYISDLS